MAMPATIAVMNPDGTADAVRAHWITGYEVGLLLKHWATESRVRSLIDKGGVSRLGPQIGERNPYDTPANPKHCSFYHRDHRGELQISRGVSTITELQHVSDGPVYLFRDGRWVTLSDSLDGSKWVAVEPSEGPE
jgi:hypothetical protein